MPIRRAVLPVLLSLAVLVSGGCASLQGRAPVEVMVAGVEPLQGEGLELRMLVKLRIQNPNDQPLEFNGVSLQMDVQGRRFATGVSGASGSVPRFGEALVEVPVSVPVLRIAQQAIGVMADERRGRLAYEMSGRLAGPAFRSLRFRSSGELALPAELFPAE
jgi:LEA14-like dessication related protein